MKEYNIFLGCPKVFEDCLSVINVFKKSLIYFKNFRKACDVLRSGTVKYFRYKKFVANEVR